MRGPLKAFGHFDITKHSFGPARARPRLRLGNCERVTVKRWSLSGVAALMLAGCGQEEAKAPIAPAPALEALTTHDLMVQVIDPSADGIWERQGWEVTAEGERETFPTTDAGWAEAEGAAATLARTAQLLLASDRVQPGPEWQAYADALHQAALETAGAAKVRDKQAFFDGGGRIYSAGAGCHEAYLAAPTGASAPANAAGNDRR